MSLTAALFLLTPAARPAPQAAPQLIKIDVAEGIYLFQTPDHGDLGVDGNAIVIVNDQDVFVFDANQTLAAARAVIAAIRQITPKPVRYVVNSHWHYDHWLGNEAYLQAFPGVEFIASDDARRIMENVTTHYIGMGPGQLEQIRKIRQDQLASGKNRSGQPLTDGDRKRFEANLKVDAEFVAELQALHPILPTITYDHHLTLYHGGREFRIMKFVGNTPGDTALYLPNEKILITGDLLVHPIPYTFNSRPSQWIESLQELDRLDANLILPGHGEPQHDKQYLELVISSLEAARKQIYEAARKGMTLEEVRKAVNFDSMREKFAHGDSLRQREFQDYFTDPIVDRLFKEATGQI
jgi:glyoxylase-like metal-dependent hydrolase (beta-lactamase superfamily II)